MRNKKGDIETNYEVRSLDATISLAEYNALPKTPLFVILDNLRSAFNVGSIFRLCDALRVEGLFLCGCTAYPPHAKLDKTALGTIDFVPWKRFETTAGAVSYLKARGVPVWAVETTSHAQRYSQATFPDRLGLVFGNEALGVSRDVLEVCDRVIEIPLLGFKNSINVAASCAVVGFRFLAEAQPEKKGPLSAGPGAQPFTS